jgi:hypothetical protein
MKSKICFKLNKKCFKTKKNISIQQMPHLVFIFAFLATDTNRLVLWKSSSEQSPLISICSVPESEIEDDKDVIAEIWEGQGSTT